ncbi:MAG TPA: arginine--tRNA ligase [Gammaproteobacteria bacterium]|nr:arginine--tRNA ligase [Gammaproteobacteria bacterium]
MKQSLEKLINRSLAALQEDEAQVLPADIVFTVEKTRDKRHGDYASNVAMVLAGRLKCNPRELAEKIVSVLPDSELVAKTDIAGPGFINFTLTRGAHLQVIPDILNQAEAYGSSDTGQGKRVLLEFVSANPTGPLHIGHGRGAAYGAAITNLLQATGYNVTREYYVNDAGRQMDILAASVYLRYLQVCGSGIKLPAKAYQGDYVKVIAERIHRERSTALLKDNAPIQSAITSTADEEEQLDNMITSIKQALGDNDYDYLFGQGLQEILSDIEDDLKSFGIEFDDWFSEKRLLASGKVKRCIDRLEETEFLYKQEGATWFRSTAFGDEKDRVVIRDNGQLTYFASDIAYHMDKFERGYDAVIDIWGADHHGYIARVRAALTALGIDNRDLTVLLVQFASLYRGNEKVQMSTRSGQFVTLRELRDEVGKDATRFFYVMRKSEQHLDFDMELAKSRSQDNPVYYIQYAHARICSVFRQCHEKNMTFTDTREIEKLTCLEEQHEEALLTRLTAYPELIATSASSHEPHQLCYYLRDLANDFHTYYNACQILVEDEPLRNARLSLLAAIRQVIQNGLTLLGVSAPEAM